LIGDNDVDATWWAEKGRGEVFVEGENGGYLSAPIDSRVGPCTVEDGVTTSHCRAVLRLHLTSDGTAIHAM
jgi:hypothetical protein